MASSRDQEFQLSIERRRDEADRESRDTSCESVRWNDCRWSRRAEVGSSSHSSLSCGRCTELQTLPRLCVTTTTSYARTVSAGTGSPCRLCRAVVCLLCGQKGQGRLRSRSFYTITSHPAAWNPNFEDITSVLKGTADGRGQRDQLSLILAGANSPLSR